MANQNNSLIRTKHYGNEKNTFKLLRRGSGRRIGEAIVPGIRHRSDLSKRYKYALLINHKINQANSPKKRKICKLVHSTSQVRSLPSPPNSNQRKVPPKKTENLEQKRSNSRRFPARLDRPTARSNKIVGFPFAIAISSPLYAFYPCKTDTEGRRRRKNGRASLVLCVCH